MTNGGKQTSAGRAPSASRRAAGRSGASSARSNRGRSPAACSSIPRAALARPARQASANSCTRLSVAGGPAAGPPASTACRCRASSTGDGCSTAAAPDSRPPVAAASRLRSSTEVSESSPSSGKRWSAGTSSIEG